VITLPGGLSAGIAYHALALGALLVFALILAVNLRALPRIRAFAPPAGVPFLSLLVPARDEAANIEACLRGLLAQDYPAFEVIALDDESSDGTGGILARLAAADPRLRVITGGPPRAGWTGKANACRQLAEAARGDLLLFTDADVRHAPPLLRHAVATALALDAGLLSIFPTQITVTWLERLIVPLMQHFTVFTLLPLPLLRRARAPAFAAANGEFLLFQRAAYRACGGHGAVRGAVLEDVGLARAVKAAGYRVALADGERLVTCRMYRNAAEVWAGFSKNLFAFVNRSYAFLAVAALAGLALWTLPPLLALAALPGALRVGGPAWAGAALPLAEYAVAVGMRLALARRFGGRAGDAFLHPLGMAILVAIAINSARLARRGRAVWKGRRLA
jgi:chlorobactene glucosyltransferase